MSALTIVTVRPETYDELYEALVGHLDPTARLDREKQYLGHDLTHGPTIVLGDVKIAKAKPAPKRETCNCAPHFEICRVCAPKAFPPIAPRPEVWR
jgi:hypothetical protein